MALRGRKIQGAAHPKLASPVASRLRSLVEAQSVIRQAIRCSQAARPDWRLPSLRVPVRFWRLVPQARATNDCRNECAPYVGHRSKPFRQPESALRSWSKKCCFLSDTKRRTLEASEAVRLAC